MAIDAGFFGEKDIILSTAMIKKYTFAAFLNCHKRLFGAQDSNEYFDVLISLDINSVGTVLGPLCTTLLSVSVRSAKEAVVSSEDFRSFAIMTMQLRLREVHAGYILLVAEKLWELVAGSCCGVGVPGFQGGEGNSGFG